MTRSGTWSTTEIPDLGGKTVLVTGASSGIGLETATALAAAGATTVLGCRNPAKAAAALDSIAARAPGSAVELLQLDLADQQQIGAAARETLARFPVVDCLVNNAGVMSSAFERTADGFESTFGTNHLGHFAFTGLVLPALLAAPRGRVVSVSSLSHRFGDTDWEVQEQHTYKMSRAYARSKLANLLFAFELQRRLVAAGATALSVGVHPGFAQTSIMGSDKEPSRVERWSKRLGERLVPSAEDAARSSLRAATAPDVQGGQYYGPGGLAGVGGAPVAVPPSRRALRTDDQARLWDLSSRLTGVTFALPDPARADAGSRPGE